MSSRIRVATSSSIHAATILCIALFTLAGIGSCKKAKPRPKTKRAAPIVAAAPTSVPITSKSAAAIALFKRGRQLTNNIRFGEAREQFRKALKLDPDFALAHAYLGKLAPSSESQHHLQRAVELSAKLPEAERLLIKLCVTERNRDFHETRGLLRTLATIVPRDWRVQLRVGSYAFHERKWDDAIRSLRRASELKPDAGEPYNMLAYAFAAKGQYGEAIAAAKRYAALKPNEPNPLDTLGELLMRAGRLDEAEKAFRAALKRNPRFWRAWEGIAVARFARRDWARGRAALRKAEHQAGKAERRYFYRKRALSWAAEGKTAQALKLLRAAEASATTPQGKAGTALWLASFWAMHQRPDKALAKAAKVLRESRELKPKQRALMSFWADLIRSVSLCQKREIGKAAKLMRNLESYAARRPNHSGIQSALYTAKGLLALAKGDGNAAVRQLSRCYPDATRCRALLARAQEKLGDRKGASMTRQEIFTSVYRSMEYIFQRSRVGLDPRARALRSGKSP